MCLAAVTSPGQTLGRNEASRPHRRTTLRTGERRTRTSDTHDDLDFKKPQHAEQLLTRVPVEETVVMHPTQPGGHHVLDDFPDEARAADGAGHPLAALAVSVGEGHRVAVVGDQLLNADDAAIQIARQVLQRRLPGADVTAVRDPALRQRCRRREAGGSQALDYSGAPEFDSSGPKHLKGKNFLKLSLQPLDAVLKLCRCWHL